MRPQWEKEFYHKAFALAGRFRFGSNVKYTQQIR